jgi:urease accessory protein
MISSAAAHTGVSDPIGFIHGLAHPFGGLDHVPAMVAVGFLAANLGGPKLMLIFGGFLLAMAVGSLLATWGVDLPAIETGVALSVFILGMAIICRWRPAGPAAALLLTLFGVFHGHAHGTEITVHTSALGYAAGFLVATATLHAIGIGLGGLVDSYLRPMAKFVGGAMAVAGFGMIAGVL